MDFLTVKEFATRMHLSEQQVRIWIRKDKIKAVKLSDGPRARYRIPESEVERLHAECYKED